jgi:hypothetical protein
MAGCRGLVLALVAALAAAACSDSETPAPGVSGAAGAGSSDGGGNEGGAVEAGSSSAGGVANAGASDGGAGDFGGADGDGYAGSGSGECTPGVPRCHGDFGYQLCEQDGSWSQSHSCAGYSVNGTSSYCFDIPSAEGEPWATCVDPACWYWMKRGLDLEQNAVGSCSADGRLQRCSVGGTLTLEDCEGACVQVGALDGRALGFCAKVCESGARECLGAGLYRECGAGRWHAEVSACPAGQECNPLSHGALPDIRCGGVCEPGTTRCRDDKLAIEICSPASEWELERTCPLGRCLPAGPQAECQAECSAGQRACAFDGATSERVCDERGAWGAEQPCVDGAACRFDGTLALGCVECVGATFGGNAFGVADSRCLASELQSCSESNTWQPAEACADGGTCTASAHAASSIAACAAP